MSKYLQYAKHFFSNPKDFIFNGLSKNHNIFKRNYLKKKYKIEKIPAISFPELEEDILIDPYIFQPGNSTIPDIILLKYLASNIKGCNFLEIGSWRGETLKNLELHCNQMTSVTLGKDDMIKMGLSIEFMQQNGLFQKTIKNLKQVFANSHHFDFSKLGQKFDLIFIDGDHTYEGVLNDTKKVFANCVHENTVVVWHDYKDAHGIRHSVLAGILDGLSSTHHSNLYAVSSTLCAIYLPSEMKSKLNLNTSDKNEFNVFKLSVSSNLE